MVLVLLRSLFLPDCCFCIDHLCKGKAAVVKHPLYCLYETKAQRTLMIALCLGRLAEENFILSKFSLLKIFL